MNIYPEGLLATSLKFRKQRKNKLFLKILTINSMIKPLFTFASLDPGVSGGDGERLVDRAPVCIQLRGRGQV